jgi:NAD(P)-dependent dehydrogenase (short-subunit alcohol dehydrogenase family)
VLVPPVGSFGHSPAQIEHAAWDQDGQKSLDRRRNGFGLEMHDDGLAQDVGEACLRNPIESWKDRPFELDLRMSPSRFGQKSFRRVEANSRIASGAEPGGVTTAAATDIRSGTGDEKPIASRHSRIDVLINNAGIHAFKSRVTKDGYPEMVAVNYLAPWLFTNILLETVVRSAPSRIVAVASEASRRAAGFDPLAALVDKRQFSARGSSVIYGQTKLLNIMFSMELARRLTGTGVAVNCLCTGINVTGLGRELWFAAPLERLLTWLNVGNPERGAGIIVSLASDPAFAGVTGGYFSVSDARRLAPVAPGDDPQALQALWQATAERVAAFYREEVVERRSHPALHSTSSISTCAFSTSSPNQDIRF